MSDETKPSGEVETNPDAPAVTTPDTGSDTGTIAASDPTTEPSPENITPEQYQAAVRGFNEKAREAADANRRTEQAEAQALQYQQMAQAAAGVAKQATDPREAAWAEIQSARDAFDTPRERAAFDAIKALDKQEFLNDSMRQNTLQQSLPRAGKMIGVSDQNQVEQQLGAIYTSLTPEDLAFVKLRREGKAEDFLLADKRQRDEQAQQAQLLQSLGAGGGRTVPGSLSQQAPAPTHDEWNYDMYGADTQKAILEAGGKIVVTDNKGNVIEDRTDFWRAKHGL